jgi:hypothetical protein
VLYQQICIQTIRMIKIGFGAFLQGFVGNVLVIMIVCQVDHIFFSPKFLEYGSCQRGLQVKIVSVLSFEKKIMTTKTQKGESELGVGCDGHDFD